MALPRFLALLLLPTLACVINVGEDDCSECDNAPRCHSHLEETTQECLCDPGHQWKNPGNDNDFECEKIPPKPGTSDCIEDNSYVLGDSCFCMEGFKWCSSDQEDLTCCVDEDQTMSVPVTGSGSDTDASGETGEREVELPPCTIENALGCTNPEPDRREPTYQCVGGEWIPFDEDLHCQNTEGGDFSTGCYLMETQVIVACEVGPGSACADSDRACVDATTLHVCLFGRLSARNCEEYCGGMVESTGPAMHGSCEANDCVCCTEGDEGCPA
jgi:hypothetical protein